MKRIGTHIAILIFWTVLLNPFQVIADEIQAPSAYEELLLRQINEARRDPLLTIQSLGLSVDNLISEDDPLKGYLETGLQPLIWDNRLFETASAHNAEMLSKQFYSKWSSDGKHFAERFLESGYLPVLSGESLGMLAFGNFLDPKVAVEAILGNLIREELNPERSQPRNILNPKLKDVGISLKAGQYLNSATGMVNIYVATCDFGSEDIESLKKETVDIIQQARNNDVNTTNSGEYGYGFQNLLEWDQRLERASAKHLKDMKSDLFFGHHSKNGNGPLQRLIDEEYYAIGVGEIIGLLAVNDYVSPASAVNYMVNHVMGTGETDADYLIPFNREFTDIGLNIDTLVLKKPNGSLFKAYLMVMSLAYETGIFSGRSTEVYLDEFVILYQEEEKVAAQ